MTFHAVLLRFQQFSCRRSDLCWNLSLSTTVPISCTRIWKWTSAFSTEFAKRSLRILSRGRIILWVLLNRTMRLRFRLECSLDRASKYFWKRLVSLKITVVSLQILDSRLRVSFIRSRFVWLLIRVVPIIMVSSKQFLVRLVHYWDEGNFAKSLNLLISNPKYRDGHSTQTFFFPEEPTHQMLELTHYICNIFQTISIVQMIIG